MLLKWIGGKNQLAPYIISKMPTHDIYYEVFFGAGHVFWQKNLAKKNVINDLNSRLVNLYKVINDENLKEKLKNLISDAIYAKDLFEAFKVLYDDKNAKWLDIGKQVPSKVETMTLRLCDKCKQEIPRLVVDKEDWRVKTAFIYLYLNRASFNGMFQSFANRDDSSPICNLEPTIDKMFKKLKDGQVVICNENFEDFLLDKDKPRAFAYLDPPYWVTTQTEGKNYYEKVMDTFQHGKLSRMLHSMKDLQWLLSYDDVPEIRELYPEVKGKIWVRQTPKTNQSSANATVGRDGIETVYKQELLIANYDLDNIGGLFG